MIEFININKSYGKKQVLKNISFSVGSGVICGLLGLNGAGKSTLMKIMCSLAFPNSGDIFVNGKSVLKIENCLNKKANNTAVDSLQKIQFEKISEKLNKKNLKTVSENADKLVFKTANDNMDKQDNNTVVDNLQNTQVELINNNIDKQANNTVVDNYQNTQSKTQSNNLNKCLNNNNSIGFMIESPAFYNNLTGRQNLKAFASFFPNVNANDINRVLEITGILKCADIIVKRYSLGMKQRLYFAYALMSSPNVLVLDEPFNGIDPITVKMFKTIISDMAKQGCCILISSHMIADLKSICNQVVIIDSGEIVYNDCINETSDLENIFFTAVSNNGKVQ